MKTYKCTVRVPSPSSRGTVVVWAQVVANNPIDARQMLAAQYGASNLVGIPTSF